MNHDDITAQIEALFATRDDIPLFYIESGSRLWGIASPDSDFDVRGFHLQSKAHYFDWRRHRPLIETLDGDFDFVSYDLDKMFGLVAKSNPTVFEWLRSHLVYLNALPEWEALQAGIIANFDARALFHHYLSLSRGHIHLMETDRRFTYKTAFYCIRGLLSADLASRETIPALLIDDLFAQFDRDNAVLQIARDSLERKRAKQEKEEVAPAEREPILAAIRAFADAVAQNAPPQGVNRPRLEALLCDYSIALKSDYYGQ